MSAWLRKTLKIKSEYINYIFHLTVLSINRKDFILARFLIELEHEANKGLEIAQSIIRVHHGQIEARSKPGQTEMFILLPLKF